MLLHEKEEMEFIYLLPDEDSLAPLKACFIVIASKDDSRIVQLYASRVTVSRSNIECFNKKQLQQIQEGINTVALFKNCELHLQASKGDR
jgi:hypothetical protein